MNDEHDLKVILRSRFPLVAIESFEELRVLELLERVGNLEDRPLFVWTLTEGLRRRGRPDSTPETRDPPDVLRHLQHAPERPVCAAWISTPSWAIRPTCATSRPSRRSTAGTRRRSCW